jgi:hypothetical protein
MKIARIINPETTVNIITDFFFIIMHNGSAMVSTGLKVTKLSS